MPSLVARDAFLLALAIPLVRRIVSAFVQIAAGFFQGAFAIHHARVGFLAKLFDDFGINCGFGAHLKIENC